MPTVLLAVDFDTGRLLISHRVSSERTAAPPTTWRDHTDVEVYPVRPNPAGGVNAPVQAIDVTDRSMQIFIGNPGGVMYASLIDFDRDEVNNRFTGTLSLNSEALTAAFASPSTTRINTFIQFRLIEDGKPRSVIKEIRIDRPIWEGDEPPAPEDQTPEWLVENLALIFEDSDDIDVEQDGNKFLWHIRRKPYGRIGSGADGIFVEELLPAPDGLIPQLRLESLFGGESLTDAALLTDSESVVAGGVTGQIYETQFLIRGRSELRTFSGGSRIGNVYYGADAPTGTRNWWKLSISQPPQEVYLNYSQGSEDVATLHYVTPKMLVAAGATVALTFHTMDGQQLPQSGTPPGADLPGENGVPFIQVDQHLSDVTLEGDETAYQIINVSEADTTILAIEHPHRIKSLIINVSVMPYAEEWLHNFVLGLGEDLHDGDVWLITLVMPASEIPTINIRNATTGGTILLQEVGETIARTWDLRFVFNGTAWELRGRVLFGAEGQGGAPLYDANEASAEDEPEATGGAAVAIGSGAQAQGGFSSVFGGRANTAVTDYSAVLSGWGVSSHISGEVVLGGYGFQKTFVLPMSLLLVDDPGIPVRLNTPGMPGLPVLEEDSIMSFSGHITAHCEATDEAALYFVEGLIKRIGATTTLVWSNMTVKHEDEPAWNVSMSADDDTDTLYLGVNGEDGKTIRWACSLLCTYIKLI